MKTTVYVRPSNFRPTKHANFRSDFLQPLSGARQPKIRLRRRSATITYNTAHCFYYKGVLRFLHVYINAAAQADKRRVSSKTDAHEALVYVPPCGRHRESSLCARRCVLAVEFRSHPYRQWCRSPARGASIRLCRAAGYSALVIRAANRASTMATRHEQRCEQRVPHVHGFCLPRMSHADAGQFDLESLAFTRKRTG